MKLISAIVLSVLLAVASAHPQTFPSQPKIEPTQSLGVFRIQVVHKFAGRFQGCPGYDAGTRKFTSPVLYDPATEISLSAALVEKDLPGVRENPQTSDQLTLPSHFADPPDNNREVHTEITTLKMTGNGFTVRAGRWYNNAAQQSPPAEHWRSRGEIFSDAKPGQIGNPQHDFPARSFFNVFVNIDVPHCGGLPAGTTTLYNKLPLIVSSDGLQGLPPNVIYEHDTSSAVPIYIREVVPLLGRGWRHQDELVGYLLLAGHGVGQNGSNSPQNQQKLKDQVLGRPEAQPPCDQ